MTAQAKLKFKNFKYPINAQIFFNFLI